MALNKREQTLLVITIAVVVVALTWLVTVPLWRYWKQLGQDRITAQRELEGYRQVIARAPEWQQQYDALREQLGQQTEKF
ncbi:MAG: hypothetical protein NZ483_11775, partial [Verrucomicrobiae bacterium]|nr:hypothetical protein [Verrucomicrobiae bacterium]